MGLYWFFCRKRQRGLPNCASCPRGKTDQVLIETLFLHVKDLNQIKGCRSRTLLVKFQPDSEQISACGYCLGTPDTAIESSRRDAADGRGEEEKSFAT